MRHATRVLKMGHTSLAKAPASRDAGGMKRLFNTGAETSAEELGSPPTPLAQASRACCCPGRPAVTVLMPPGPGRSHVTDLLLCGHHFRASRQALRAVGATAYDETGQLVMGPGFLDEPADWSLGAPPRGESLVPAQPEGSRRR